MYISACTHRVDETSNLFPYVNADVDFRVIYFYKVTLSPLASSRDIEFEHFVKICLGYCVVRLLSDYCWKDALDLCMTISSFFPITYSINFWVLK